MSRSGPNGQLGMKPQPRRTAADDLLRMQPNSQPITQPSPQWPPQQGYGQQPVQGFHFPQPDAAQGYAQPDPGQFQSPQDPAQFGAPQGYGETDAEFDEAMAEEEDEPRRGRRGLMIVAALVGAIGLGGGMAYAYKTFFPSRTGPVA